MKNVAQTNPNRVKKVLIAPLDWGLGHATRCIPLIRSFLQRGHQVFLAGEKAQKSLLQAEFPELPFLPLNGYRVQYGASAVQTTGLLLLQIPQILSAINSEKEWLAQMMEQYRFDVVISDNRYGLHHPQAHCVLMTHQLHIQAPLGEQVIQQLHYRFIRKFRECWVPDFPDPPGLAGILSHPHKMPPVPVRYIGPLSRFEKVPQTEKSGGILFLLSGPEPQRSLFEQLLLQQAAQHAGPITLVRGLPGNKAPLQAPPNVQVFDHLPATELSAQIIEAEWIVCRSGYSTVMDLANFHKKSILVPTPGQTEQIYLARHLQQQGFAFWQKQAGFNLAQALAAAGQFQYVFPGMEKEQLLPSALDALEQQLNK